VIPDVRVFADTFEHDDDLVGAIASGNLVVADSSMSMLEERLGGLAGNSIIDGFPVRRTHGFRTGRNTTAEQYTHQQRSAVHWLPHQDIASVSKTSAAPPDRSIIAATTTPKYLRFRFLVPITEPLTQTRFCVGSCEARISCLVPADRPPQSRRWRQAAFL
jgi:hypothetical protein